MTTPSIAFARTTSSSTRSRAALALVALVLAMLSVLQPTTPASAEQSSAVPGTYRAASGQLTAGCAVVGDGSLRCWGQGTYGQLAQGNSNAVGGSGSGPRTVAIPLPSGSVVTDVADGSNHRCALLAGGEVRCWGGNGEGQLAQGNTQDVGDNQGEATVVVSLPRPATAVTAGSSHSCALLDTGDVRCWGRGWEGQLGNGKTSTIGDDNGETSTAVSLPGGRHATAITAGDRFTCAVLDNGEVACWGHNGKGQLGQGNTTQRSTPVIVPFGQASSRAAVAVDAGSDHACATMSDGVALCWGSNARGQLGLSDADAIGNQRGELPVEVPGGGTIVSVSAGHGVTCTLTSTSVLRCAGNNAEGQLGLGDGRPSISTFSEVTINAAQAPVAVAVGYYLTCLAQADGVRCWGANDAGQLGQGTTDSYGAGSGEQPAALAPIDFGGRTFGRDSDGDGVPDFTDACPQQPGPAASGGCPAPTGSPTPTPAPNPGETTPAPPGSHAYRLAVKIRAKVQRVRVAGKCPTRARVSVKYGDIDEYFPRKSKRKGAHCVFRTTVQLAANPGRAKFLLVKISGKNLRTKTYKIRRR